MAYTLDLDTARTKLIYLAAIDGKTGANGRHSPTNLGRVLNWTYRELLSRAGTLGLPHGLTSSTGTLGSVAAGEEYISLDVPNGAAEVVGVDVLAPDWNKLDPIEWGQRRDIAPPFGQVRDFRFGGLQPAHGLGFWAIREGASVSGSTLTAAKLAIFPQSLAGKSYELFQVKQWTEITTGTDVFLLHEGWESWLLNKAAMYVTQRDTNKRTNYDTAKDAWSVADALLDDQARRMNRSGGGEPTPYMGINL